MPSQTDPAPPLTYKHERTERRQHSEGDHCYTVTTTITEDRVLRPYKEWGMFTAKGNKRLQTLAQRAIDAVARAKASGRPLRSDVRPVLIQFVAAWERMGDTKSYREASDTAVREAVGSFTDTLALASGLWDKWSVGELWDELRSEAYKRNQKLRVRRGNARLST